MSPLPATFALEPRYKEQFAGFLLAGFQPLIAALKIFGNGDAGTAAMVAAQWPTDPYVVAWMETERENAEEANRPKSPKEQQIERIKLRLDRMANDDYLKAERLLAEMMGHIEKAAPPSAVVNLNQSINERVMIVPNYGEDAEWERKAAGQQDKLIEGNVG